MTSPDGPTRRRLLAAGVAAAGALAGCQTGEDGASTVTPAPVPAAESGPRLVVRHAAAGGSGPAAEAMTGLIEDFTAERPAVPVTEARLGSGRSADRSVVRFGRLGAALLVDGGIDSYVSLEAVWNERDIPGALLPAAFADWDVVAVPVAVDLVNCLYFNPTAVADAGLRLEEYATLRDLAADRDRFDAFETLFAQPMRGPLDRLVLWESLLAGRVGSQAQYRRLLAGDAARSRRLIEATLVDFEAALSLLPEDPPGPTALLDRAVDGETAFVRLPGRSATHLRDRPDAEFGHEWSLAPMFGASGTATVTVEGFAVPGWTAETGPARTFVRYGSRVAPTRRYCRARGAIPAQADFARVVVGSDRQRLASYYTDASIHALSLAYGIGVQRSVRSRLAAALVEFEDHRDVQRAADALVAAFADATLL